MAALPGPVFYALAERLSAYQGVMALREMQQEAGSAAGAQEPAEPRSAPAAQVTPTAVLKHDKAFAGIFSFSTMNAEPVPT